MGRVRVWCDESDGLPVRTRLAIDRGRLFRVLYIAGEQSREALLRRVVLRSAEDATVPYGAEELFRARVPRTGPLRLEIERTSTLHRASLFIEEGALTRLVVAEDRYPAGTRFRLERADDAGHAAGTVQFTLGFSHAEATGLAGAVGGVDVDDIIGTPLGDQIGWRLPTVKAVVAQPLLEVQKRLKAAQATFSAWRGTILSFLPYVLIGGVGFGLYQFSAGSTAASDARIAELEAELASTRKALDAAVGAEDECLDDRKSLSAKLGDREALIEAAAAQAVAVGASRRQAMAEGTDALDDDPLAAWDGAYADDLLAAVQDKAISLSALPDSKTLARCLRFEEMLGATLPRWTLVWTPDPENRCTDAPESVVQGTALHGRWMLSEWMAWEFGPAGAAEAGAGLSDDRRSAETLTQGLRRVRQAMLQADTGDRPQVAPAQSDAWAATLFYALDLMPIAEVYDSEVPATECVSQLLSSVAAAADTPAVGSPVLPNLVEVAAGEEVPGVRPTPACAWSGVALQLGAQAVIDSLATQTMLDVETPPAN